MAKKSNQTISLEHALDNLAALAEMNLKGTLSLGIQKNSRFLTNEEEFDQSTVPWEESEGVDPIFSILNQTYSAVHQHLADLASDPEMNWENPRTEKGIAAIMELVGESADKIDGFLRRRLGKKLKQFHIIPVL